jgi:hypothetical protein
MSYQPASIIDVLLAYGSRGGALYAAYRQADNPLQLTNVLWQGQPGEALEAYRNPNDLMMVREERDAWTQIAVRSSSLRSDAVGPNAPWLRAPVEPREAYELGVRAREAREASAPRSHQGAAPSLHYSDASRIPSYQPTPAGATGSSTHSEATLGAHRGANTDVVDAPHFEAYSPSQALGTVRTSDPSHAPQITGSWPREAFHMSQTTILPQQGASEISVIVCVEIEMPVLMGEVAQDFTRDFARDVAVNFARAARTVPQTRETRGWMHSTRVTLGARMVMGQGNRPPTSAEMEHARDSLAQALAQRTLPFAQMRFADMAEWQQGIALPE